MKRVMVLVALAFALGACGQGGANEQQAAQRFLDQRNSATPAAADGAGGASAGGASATMIGVVEQVDNGTITVKRPIDGSTGTLRLASGASVRRSATIALDQIAVGDSVTVSGDQQGGALHAQAIQVGDAGPLAPDGPIGAGPVVIGSGASNSQDSVGPTGPSGATGQAVLSGTVERIDGQQLTVKAADQPSTFVQVDDQTTIEKQVEVQLDAIKVGELIMASGAQADGTFEATEVHVLPPPQAAPAR